MSQSHFPFAWRFDGTLQGTVTIDRASNTFTVRPYRRKKAYTLPLAFIAEIVATRCIKADVAAKRLAKKKKGFS